MARVRFRGVQKDDFLFLFLSLSLFFLTLGQGQQDRASTKGGPMRPHFARHTRRCSTRLFAEALKRGFLHTRVWFRKNKHVWLTGAR